MNDNVALALGMTLIAGLSTGIGSLIAFFAKRTNTRFLSAALGLSAGVMIYVSFMEILPQATQALGALYGEKPGAWAAVGLFFLGIVIAWLIDTLLPSHHVEEHTLDKSAKLKHLGLFTALALAIHNFPEGLATFMASMQDAALGVSIAVAVAIHNIPEGVAVALPVYHATGKRAQAFWYSAGSGMAEPVGAVLGFFLLRSFLHEAAFGVLFALIAGIMVYISLDELLPTAHEYGDGHKVIWGVVGGMMIMAVSLLLF